MYALAEEKSINSPPKSKDYQLAYHSYLLMYDANNIRERKQLLKNIIKDPYVCILFLTNCKPNEFEKQLVLDVIIDDPYSSYTALNLISADDPRRDDLFLSVLSNFEYAYRASKTILLNHEKQFVYELYKDTIFNKNKEIDKYFEAYTIFHNHSDLDIIEILVSKIYNERHYYFAKCLLEMYNIPEYLKDKLESLIVIDNLNNT